MRRGVRQAMLQGIGAVARAALDVLAPPRCVLCRAPLAGEGGVCGACWPRLSLIDDPSCPVSGLPLVGKGAETLASLPAGVRREPWEGLYAAMFYDRVGRRLVHRLKYHDDATHAAFMARLMARRVARFVTPRTRIVPVPLHWRRLWWRRFNQSALLARELARITGGKYVPLALERVRPTRPQTRLSARARRENLKGAFAVAAAARAEVDGREILLVDDVFTTGSTARACARALKAAGCGPLRVAVFALASGQRALHI